MKRLFLVEMVERVTALKVLKSTQTVRLLLLGVLCLLLLPWLRRWGTRPNGRAASLLLGETAVAALLIVLALF